jgi:hypothetical protein
MLFLLDSSLVDIDPESDILNRALTALLLSYQSGHHMLFMEMADLRALRAKLDPALSSSGRKALQTLYNKLPVYKEAISNIPTFVVVYLPKDGESVATREGRVWKVPLTYFSPGLLQSTILGENDRDAELYILLANQYRLNERLYLFNVSARPRSGGGSGIVRVLNNYLSTEISPCLCVTDSDKLHPGCGKSATVRGCEELAATDSRIIDYLLLEEREIENFLPIELIERSSPQCANFIEAINEVQDYSAQMWSYLDIKKGIALDWIEKKDNPTQSYWRCFLDHFRNLRENCAACNSEGKRKECECSSITGLGEKVLDKCLDYMKENPPRLTSGLFNKGAEWEEVGKLVFSFLLAPSGEAIRQA